MYRDDLEAAQARVDALQREATLEKERADEAEAEAAVLRAKNTELEALLPHRKPERARTPMEARMRRSVIGWSMIAAGVVVMLLGGRIGLDEVGQAIGLVVLVIGCWLA
jgi:hypothetical protein